MKIKVDFEELSSIMGYVNTILSDKGIDEKVKNVIFLVDSNEVTIAGYNQITFSRTVLEKVEIFDIGEKPWEFQIKASEINKIISSFSNLFKTKVDTIDIEDDGVRLKVVVHETPLDMEKDAKLAKDSVFEVENAPILPKILKDIKSDFPEENSAITSSDLLLYLGALLPLVNNDTANSTASKMYFAEDYIFTMSSSASAFFMNKLPDEFKGITLGYSSISFLKKLCEGSELISVAKTDLYVCIESGSTRAFMRYKPIKINYQMYIKKKSKEKGICIDRLYMKDVLRRMSAMGVDGKMVISSKENLTVMNDIFKQEVPLEQCKDGTEGISFTMSIPILTSLILGSDDIFTSNLYIYFVETMRGYIIYLQDKSGTWFSSTQVSKA